MKNFKKGITLMSVVIVILVLSLLTTTVVITSFNITSNLYLKKFGNEMLQVQTAVNSYITRKSGNIDFEEVTINTAGFSEVQQLQYYPLYNDSAQISLYEVNLSKIDVESVTYGNKKDGETVDRYLYSPVTGKIYYEKGFQDSKNNIYYTLTDSLMEIIK